MAETLTLQVEGMDCEHCEAKVVKAARSLKGVSKASADHENDKVELTHDPELATIDAISQAITEAGYTVAGTA